MNTPAQPTGPTSANLRKVLLVDDDPDFLELAGKIFCTKFQVDSCRTPEAAFELLSANYYDVILMDLEFHERLVDTEFTGVIAIRTLRERYPDVPVIVLSKTQDTVEITEALSAGAFHFITKHFRLDEVVNLVERAVRTTELEHRVDYIRTREALTQGELVYKSPQMQMVMDRVKRFGSSSLPVLLTGPSGTGKDLVARELHRASGRQGDYQAINVNSYPDDLFEAEIFGQERGAFTGARQQPGLLEICNGGTVFMDEIGALKPDRQSKLLRVIEEGSVRRLGSRATRNIDVRFIFATNEDLDAKRARGEFRDDLWHRISQLHLELPALKDRGEDLLFIANAFLNTFNPRRRLDRQTASALLSMDWPGNVRELKAVLSRVCLYDEDGVLSLADFESAGVTLNGASRTKSVSTGKGACACGEVDQANELAGLAAQPIESLLPFKDAEEKVLNALKSKCIEHALAQNAGNISAAAEGLGVTRQTLYTWMQQLGYDTDA